MTGQSIVLAADIPFPPSVEDFYLPSILPWGEHDNYWFTKITALVWLAPNTQSIMGYDHAGRRVGEALRAGRMRPLFLYAASLVLAFGILGIQSHSEFIYFRF